MAARIQQTRALASMLDLDLAADLGQIGVDLDLAFHLHTAFDLDLVYNLDMTWKYLRKCCRGKSSENLYLP